MPNLVLLIALLISGYCSWRLYLEHKSAHDKNGELYEDKYEQLKNSLEESRKLFVQYKDITYILNTMKFFNDPLTPKEKEDMLTNYRLLRKEQNEKMDRGSIVLLMSIESLMKDIKKGQESEDEV